MVGALDNHFYLGTRRRYSVFSDGKPISTAPYPKGISRVNLLWRSALMACRRAQDGIFQGDEDDRLVVRSRYGTQTVQVSAAIYQLESRRQCGEYVLLENVGDNTTLWSLTPGRQLELHPLKTACNPNAFALNEDGSIHYRCGTKLRYLDASRTKDTLIGDSMQAQGATIRDRWLVTPDYGTLYATTTDPIPGQPAPKICFARLLESTMQRIGCTPENAD